MVNTCSYCQKPIERLIFCSSSHKVLYHRKKKAGLPMVNSLPKVNTHEPKSLPFVNNSTTVDKPVPMQPKSLPKVNKEDGTKDFDANRLSKDFFTSKGKKRT
jgi:hypothetical protein